MSAFACSLDYSLWRAIQKWVRGQQHFNHHHFCFFNKDFIYLLLERGESEGERGRETSTCERYINQLPLMHPLLGTWPATQACAWLGVKPATLWFTGQHSIHWATPARANHYHFYTWTEWNLHEEKETLFYVSEHYFI